MKPWNFLIFTVQTAYLSETLTKMRFIFLLAKSTSLLKTGALLSQLTAAQLPHNYRGFFYSLMNQPHIYMRFLLTNHKPQLLLPLTQIFTALIFGSIPSIPPAHWTLTHE
jgi:hypothetical protein